MRRGDPLGHRGSTAPRTRARDLMAARATTGAGWARRAKSGSAGPFSTYGIVPSGGIDRPASLQEAADGPHNGARPSFFRQDCPTARSRAEIGRRDPRRPGNPCFRYNGGGALISIEDAVGIRLTGLTLQGEARPIDGGTLLVAEGVKGLTLSDCRIVGSAQDGVVLREVSGRITDCEIGDIRGGGLFSEDAGGLEIGHNHVRDCGDNAILVWRSAVGEDGVIAAVAHVASPLRGPQPPR